MNSAFECTPNRVVAQRHLNVTCGAKYMLPCATWQPSHSRLSTGTGQTSTDLYALSVQTTGVKDSMRISMRILTFQLQLHPAVQQRKLRKRTILTNEAELLSGRELSCDSTGSRSTQHNVNVQSGGETSDFGRKGSPTRTYNEVERC